MGEIAERDTVKYPYVGETLGAFFARIFLGETCYKVSPSDLVDAVNAYIEVNPMTRATEESES